MPRGRPILSASEKRLRGTYQPSRSKKAHTPRHYTEPTPSPDQSSRQQPIRPWSRRKAKAVYAEGMMTENQAELRRQMPEDLGDRVRRGTPMSDVVDSPQIRLYGRKWIRPRRITIAARRSPLPPSVPRLTSPSAENAHCSAARYLRRLAPGPSQCSAFASDHLAISWPRGLGLASRAGALPNLIAQPAGIQGRRSHVDC